jgi:HEAT repeat protein
VVEAALHWGFAPPFPLVGRRRNLRAGGGSSIRAHEYYPYLDLMAHRAVLAAKAKATPYLARALAAEPDAFRRGELVHALGHAGATEELVAALRDDDSSVRRRAAFCLVVLGDRSFTALREVIACLENDEDEPFPIDWAATAADTLVKLGKEAIPLLEARLRKLENESAEQERIEEVLARIRKESN